MPDESGHSDRSGKAIAIDPFGRPIEPAANATDPFGNPMRSASDADSPAPVDIDAPSTSTAPSAAPVAVQPPSSTTTALVLGIAGLFFPVVFSIPAWIVGVQARRESRALPGRPGYGAATAGYVLGIVSTVFWVLAGVLMVLGLVLLAGSWETSGTD